MDPYEGTLNDLDAAKYLGVNYFTFRTGHKGHDVPREMIGNKLRFRITALDAWRKTHPNAMKQREAA